MRAALCMMAAAGSATAQTPVLDDTAIYRLAGGPSELRSLLRRTITEDPMVLRAIRRVGTPAGCAALYRAERRLGTRHDAAFRPLLIAATRRQVPTVVLQREATALNMGFVANPALAAHRPKVLDDLARTGGPVIAIASRDLRALLAAELAHPLRLPGPANSWREDRPSSLEGACLFYVAAHRDAVFANLPAGVK